MICWYSGKCSKEPKECANCLRFKNMSILVNNSQLPIDLQYPKILEPEVIDRESFNILNSIKRNIEVFVNRGDCLYLWSSGCGNGKTTWASKLLMSYFNRIWPYSQMKCRGIYIYTPTLLNSLKTQYISDKSPSELVENIKQSELVVFDDLGVGKLSDFDKSNLLDIIDYRLNSHKSIIFTSNLDYTSLVNTFGDRLASRIHSASLVIELRGRDRRGEFR